MAKHVWLSLTKGGVREKNFPIKRFPYVIGRSKEANLPILDPGISARHCQIEAHQDRYLLSDLGSSNGTSLCGQIITESSPLNDGDIIKIGDILLTFHLETEDISVLSSSEQTLAMSQEQLIRAEDQAAPLSPVSKPDFSVGAEPPDLKQINKKAWQEYFPFLSWGRGLSTLDFKYDLIAAISVMFLLVPQGMAYALLAGMPPISGLYASMLPMFLYALFGSSRHVSVGPVSLDSILVAIAIAALAQSGTDQYITMVVTLALMIGAIQLLMGLFRIGFLVNFLSHPVLLGFMAAAAAITIMSQMQHFIGTSHDQISGFWSSVMVFVDDLPHLNFRVLLVGLAAVAVLMLLKHFAPKWPAAMVLVIAGTLLSYFVGLSEYGFALVGEIPMGLPSLQWPSITLAQMLSLLPYAFVLALVGFAGTISIAKSLADEKQYEIDANQEMIGLGLANISSSLSQGIPVSGGLSRSRLNARAGAKSPLASILTAIFMAATLMTVAPLLEPLPKVVLAAIIVVSVVGLIDIKETRYLFRVKQSEGWLVLYTFAATLAIGVIEGLVLGVVASMVLFITLNTRPNAALLGQLPGSEVYRNILNYPQASTIDGLAIVRIDASFYFANTEFLRKILRYLSHSNHNLRAIVLDASSINDLDSSADRALQILVKQFRDRDIELYVAGVKAPVRAVMQRTGLYQTLGANHFFYTIDAAVKRYKLREKARAVGEFF